MRAVKKDGTIMQLSLSATAVVNADERVIGTVTIVFDITEKMELESALKASLEKMNRVVDETVEALASVVETRDPYTASHQRRVASLACAIAGGTEGIGVNRTRFPA